jgi:thioredoxin 1
MYTELDQDLDLKTLLSQNFHCIVLYFSATWCGPCKKVLPEVKDIAHDENYKNKFLFIKVDVDDYEDLSEECNVNCMPTFLFYVNGELKDNVEGANSDLIRTKCSLLCN